MIDASVTEAPDFLECAHCGDVAIESDADGYFTDGTEGPCMSCGMPGIVSVDDNRDVWWNDSQDDDARCTRPDCDECNPKGAA